MTEFERQKRDAVERVRKMNLQYRRKIEPQQSEVSSAPQPTGSNTPIDIIKLIRFDSVRNDPDRLLLLGVLLLLSAEKTDPKLMYALLYIMI